MSARHRQGAGVLHTGEASMTVTHIGGPYGARLFPQHQALLEASAIAVEVADERGYVSVDTKTRLTTLGFEDYQTRNLPGLLIPVHSTAGTSGSKLWQYRPDSPRLNTEGKPIKYETPGGSRLIVDCHPSIRADLADPEIPLIVTEGVRKADAAISQGLCCLALLGVWGWRGTNEHGGKAVLPDWDDVALNGRDVVLAFDSDIVDKPAVRQALDRLAVMLSRRGARIFEVRFDPAPDGSKVGLDDFFATGGTVDDLAALTTPYEPEQAELPPTEEPAPSTTTSDGNDADELSRPFRRIRLDLRSPPPPVETVGRYAYAGGLTILQSEPGAGKSWFATDWARQEVEQGNDVVYMDEEGGPDIVTERLIALGADPDAADEHLHYFAFENRRWNADDLAELDDLIASVPHCTLAVLDSLPDFLAAALLSEDSAQDVTTFVNTVLRRFRDAGIAQLLLDHLVKPPTNEAKKRSRYSRGSGAKLAKADATILLEVAEEFDATHSGRLNLWKTKDRRGRLDLPTLGKPPLAVAVTVDKGTVRIGDAQPVEHGQWDGPTACMSAVLGILADAAPDDMSGAALVDAMRARDHQFRDATIRQAANRLVLDGSLVSYTGRRGAHMYRFATSSDTSAESEMHLEGDF